MCYIIQSILNIQNKKQRGLAVQDVAFQKALICTNENENSQSK